MVVTKGRHGSAAAISKLGLHTGPLGAGVVSFVVFEGGVSSPLPPFPFPAGVGAAVVVVVG